MSLDAITTVRLLKGSSAKAQILLAFVFARAINGLDINDLREWTDLGREAIYHACETLERQPMGMLTHTINAKGKYRWYPTGAMLPIIRELNHGAAELPGGALELEAGDSQESPEATPEPLNVVDVERRNSLPTITTLTTTLSSQESPEATPGNHKSKNAVPTIQRKSANPPAVVKTPLERKLDEHQIAGRKRREILEAANRNDQPITPGYVQAHIDYARQENKWDNPVGMAINRILDGMSVPQVNTRIRSKYDNSFNLCPECHTNPCSCYEHDDGCDCIKCRAERPTCIWHENGSPFCGKPATPGSDRWCADHYQIGVATYNTGQIEDGDQP